MPLLLRYELEFGTTYRAPHIPPLSCPRRLVDLQLMKSLTSDISSHLDARLFRSSPVDWAFLYLPIQGRLYSKAFSHPSSPYLHTDGRVMAIAQTLDNTLGAAFVGACIHVWRVKLSCDGAFGRQYLRCNVSMEATGRSCANPFSMFFMSAYTG